MRSISIVCAFIVCDLASLPIHPVWIEGSGNIELSQNVCTIHAPDKALIHWDDFSIEEGEQLIFALPKQESVVFNRVVEANPSRLMGRLDSNGRVVLVNPAGILIGKNGVINTAAFIVSSLDAIDRVFIERGMITGRGVSRGIVVNEGTIRGDEVCLAGFEVKNNGRIESHETVLVGTNEFSVAMGPLDIRTKLNAENWKEICFEKMQDFAEINFELFDSRNMPIPTVIQNGVIIGSKVVCLADAMDISGEIFGKEVYLGGDYQGKNEFWRNAQIVRIDGNVNADGVFGGRVIAWSDGALGFYGTISAKGVEQGGFAEVSGRSYLDFKGLADLTAETGKIGTLLLDPPDISINTNPDSAGVIVGPSYTIPNLAAVDINNTILGMQLDVSNVIISSNTLGGGTGNISVDAPLSWTMAPSTLTLSTIGTAGSIVVNDAITSATGGSVILESAVDISVLTILGQVDLNMNSGSISLSAGRDILIEGNANSLRVGSGKISISANRNVTVGAFLLTTLPDLNLATPQISVIADADLSGDGDVQIGTGTMTVSAGIRTEEGDIFIQGFNVGVGDLLNPNSSEIDAGAGFVYGGITVNAYNDFNMTGGLATSYLNWRGGNTVVSVRNNANLIGGDVPNSYALMQGGGGGFTVLAVGNDLLIRGGTANDCDAGIDGIAVGPTNNVSVLVGRDFRFESQMGSPTNTESAIAGFDNTMIRVGRDFFMQGGFDPTNLNLIFSANPGTISSIFCGGDMIFQNEITQPIFQIAPFNVDSTDLRAGGDIQIGADIDKTGASGYIRVEADASIPDLWTATPNSVVPMNGNMSVLSGTPLATPFPVNANGLGAVIVDTGSFGAATWTTASGDISIISKDLNTLLNWVDFITGGLANQINISTTSGNVEINGFRNIFVEQPILTTGNVFVRSMNNISVDQLVSGNNIVFVVDEQGPFGLIGGIWNSDGGSFNLSIGANLISVGNLQIFTARQNNNSIFGLLNGQFFTPGTLFIDTDTEHWCVYFGGSGSAFAGPQYTVFYKECLQEIASQAELIVTEMLVGLHAYDAHPGWWQSFFIAHAEAGPVLEGTPYVIESMTPFYLTYPRLKYFDLPKNYTAIIHPELLRDY